MSSPQAYPLPAADHGTAASDVSVHWPGPASVLADRLAAALVHHEPGWRLPRHSALARRYNVSAAAIDAAVEELASRCLVRRMPDGQVYRASPAEYVIALDGVPALRSHVDAMGGRLSCRSRQVTWRLPPEDICWALHVPSDQQVCVVKYHWTADGKPAAIGTTYLPAEVAARLGADQPAPAPPTLDIFQLDGGAGQLPPATAAAGPPLAGLPTALHIEMQAPPPAVARSLRLTVGQPAVMVTIRFADADSGQTMALTVAALRSDAFRVTVQTSPPPLRPTGPHTSSSSWTRLAEDWEP